MPQVDLVPEGEYVYEGEVGRHVWIGPTMGEEVVSKHEPK